METEQVNSATTLESCKDKPTDNNSASTTSINTKTEDNENQSSTQEKIPCKAKIAKPHLLRCKLEPHKTYFYCTCGYSNTQPFCDKTCETSKDIKGWKPIEFHVTAEQTFWSLCGCKRSKSEPFCDGSHINLDW